MSCLVQRGHPHHILLLFVFLFFQSLHPVFRSFPFPFFSSSFLFVIQSQEFYSEGLRSAVILAPTLIENITHIFSSLSLTQGPEREYKVGLREIVSLFSLPYLFFFFFFFFFFFPLTSSRCSSYVCSAACGLLQGHGDRHSGWARGVGAGA